MATTTPNFGWDIPQSTDLVKDGATAIAALGTDIDTSLVDLKGGTTGQILSKNSNTDMDFIWITNDQGDITAVTAGTGITGGGSSGAVTITNDMATTITAAGDIVIGTGSGTYDNLPIGTTGQVLTADTTVSPYKVKWASGSVTLNEQIFTSTGTFTVPSGVTKVWVEVRGGGGGGGGGSGSYSGGGGGGGQLKMQQLSVTPGASITATIGAGGNGGASGNDGNNGNSSTFDTITASAGNFGRYDEGGYSGMTGGGNGGGSAGAGAGGAASANSGAGGGGGARGSSGGNGGSGIIVVRWLA